MQKHKFISKNENGRDFIVGDLHGCFTEFNQALHDVSFNKEVDRVFSVGDLVDRGKDNLSCLKLILNDWFIAVQGNHEVMMCDAVLHNHSMHLWTNNGGEWFYDLDINERLIVEELVKDIEMLPLAITLETEFGNIGLCHAQSPSTDWNEVIDEKNLTGATGFIEKMIWARTKIMMKNETKIENVFATVHGHTPLKHVVTLGNSIFLDTGAVFGNKLTLLPVSEIEGMIK